MIGSQRPGRLITALSGLFVFASIAALVVAPATGARAQSSGEGVQEGPAKVPTLVQTTGQATVGAPETFVPVYTDTAPSQADHQYPARFQQIRQAADQAFYERGQRLLAESPRVTPQRPDIPPTAIQSRRARAPESIRVYRRQAVAAGNTSSISEPSVAQSGRYAWMTWNWYAGRTTNGGATWSYTNPYADFPDFCCDQDVIYDRGRDTMIWYRQGVAGSVQNPNDNIFKLGVSSNSGASFCTYTFRPTAVNGAWTSQWFDYPHMGVSNDFLYITTNMFSLAGSFQRMVLFRMPLEALSNCSGFSYFYWTRTDGWSWTPVSQATDDFYVLDHTTGQLGSSIRIFTQPGDTSGLSFVDEAVPAFTFANRNSTCIVPGGSNPCARADSRILSVALRRDPEGGDFDEIVGTWNAREGGAFTYPYTEAAGFRAENGARTSRPLVWNPNFAWLYGVVGANDRGHLGLSILWFDPNLQPAHVVGIKDEITPFLWQVALGRRSTANWGSSASGDYLRVRSHAPQGVGWTATGYYRTSTGFQEFYTVFGRERDREGIFRYFFR